jgi:predicted MPP superfamily phosphohydrolase
MNQSELTLSLTTSKNVKISAVKHLVTTYAWYTIVFLVALVLVLNFPTQKTSEIHSNSAEFNPSLDPTYFVHLTDIHISVVKEKSKKRFISALNFIKNCKAQTVAITGDINDNWKRHPGWKEAKQNENDQKLYRELLNSTVSELATYIDQPGNHDLFGVYSFDSPSNLIIRTSHFFEQMKNLSYQNFTVSTYDSPVDNTTFVIVNPMIFPSLMPLVDIFVDPTVELLNRVEKTLQEVDTNRQIVLLNHYPAYMWFDVRSDYGHTFREMNQIYNINIALSGHTHPSSHVPVHHKENLEVIGVDNINNQKLGVVSFDNGNTVYSAFHINDAPKAIVTNPVPCQYLTRHDTFNNNEVYIRLLVFTDDHDVNITVTEKGNAIGNLKYVRTIRDGVQLYSLKHNFSNGKHILSFDGFYKHEIQFFVGDVYPSQKEYLGNFYNVFFSITPIFYILFAIFFIILFPVDIESCSVKLTMFVKEKLEWLFTYELVMRQLIPAGLFGFFFVRWRIRSIPWYIRITLFIGLFAPLVLPVVVQTIEGRYGVITTFKIYYPEIIRRNIWGDIFKLAYMWFVEAPAVFMCSMFYKYHFSRAFIVDIGLFVFSCLFCILFTYTKISETAKIYLAFAGPLFIIWPLFMLAIVAFWRKADKNRNTANYQISYEEDKLERTAFAEEEEYNIPVI